MVQKSVSSEVKRRGRPRAYDPAVAIEQAATVFWKAGYAGTSLDDLAAGRKHGRGLLALQHRVGDLRRVGQRRDAGLDHLEACDRDPGRNLLRQLTRDQVGRAAQALSAKMTIG